MTPFTTIGIICKRDDVRASATLQRLLGILQVRLQSGRVERVLVSSENSGADAGGIENVPREMLAQHCGLVIVIGGDGTLLGAARSLAPANVPIFGINQGRLGFLVEVKPEQIESAIDAVLAGRYSVEARGLLSTCVRHDDGNETPAQLAVNDVVIRNLAAIRMLEFETWLDDEFICRHRADGLIVSTPTGSTAYALSSGGPIVHPELPALTLVPICPHTLTDRPIVVPAGRLIRVITLGESSGGAHMTCDGQVGIALNTGDSLEITPSPHRLRLLHAHDYSYFSLLRNKLLWGRGVDMGPERA